MISENDRSQAGVEGGADQQREVLRFIAPSVRWIAAQHRALLRQALGPQGHKAMARLVAETLEIEAEVARRVEARLPELLLHEVRGVFEDLLGVNGGGELGPEGAAGVPRRAGDAEVLNGWC